MDIDLGLLRFFTKVAQKAPRGLRLLLFKEKYTNEEKLVFIVKTASDEIDKLALSKMTWQVEQSKTTAGVVVVRLIILPDGSDKFFTSETGLIMNEEKDRKNLHHLASQKSIEIFFFNDECEFHSKIELLTTFNMSQSAHKLLEQNPLIDQGKLIVKSDNLSEQDIKSAMTGKIQVDHVSKNDLYDAIQKKMPTVSKVDFKPKTKPEEFTKTSIKSNDVVGAGDVGKSYVKPIISDKKSDIKSTSTDTKITADDLLKTIPPDKLNLNDYVNPKDTKITPDELLKTIPPDKLNINSFVNSKPEIKKEEQKIDLNNLTADDLMGVLGNVSDTKISADDLLKSIPPNTINSSDVFGSSFDQTKNKKDDGLNLKDLTADDLKNVLGGLSKSKISAEDLLKSIPPDVLSVSSVSQNKQSTSLGTDNLKDAFKEDKPSFNDGVKTTVIAKDDLLSALISEPTPLKAQEQALLNDLMSEPTPLKALDGNSSNLAKEIESSIKIIETSSKKDDLIDEDDLLKALKGEL